MKKTTPKNIRLLTQEELEKWLAREGEKPYRAKQILEWLWQKHVTSFEDMTNLSKPLRLKLQEHFFIETAQLNETLQSKDGSLKNAVELPDGLHVESVVIPTGKRVTVCVSSQVGCSLDCTFCATAKLKRMRNLTYAEIVDQVKQAIDLADEHYTRRLTNIVFMGMGEPLLNYTNVNKAIEIITSPKGLGLSPKRITLSTAGIPKMIKHLASDQPKINLAVSLHSAIDEVRSRLMPVNERTGGLIPLMESLREWYRKTKNKITFEYLVLKDINDNDLAIEALIHYAKRVPSKINLIRYNPANSFNNYQDAGDRWFLRYQKRLKEAGITATIRHSAGQDIDAACGQLAGKYETLLPKIVYKTPKLKF